MSATLSANKGDPKSLLAMTSRFGCFDMSAYDQCTAHNKEEQKLQGRGEQKHKQCGKVHGVKVIMLQMPCNLIASQSLHTEPFTGDIGNQAFKQEFAHSLTMSVAVNRMSVNKPGH